MCALPDVIVLFIDLSRDNHVGADVEDIEVAPSTWDVLNGAMDASKPSTSGRAWAETASRERDSVPPTEEVAVTVWVVPAPAGARDGARGRVEGEAGGQGWRDRPGDRVPGGVGEGEGGGLAHEELGGGGARDDGGLEDGDGDRGRVGAVAGVGVDRVGGLVEASVGVPLMTPVAASRSPAGRAGRPRRNTTRS